MPMRDLATTRSNAKLCVCFTLFLFFGEKMQKLLRTVFVLMAFLCLSATAKAQQTQQSYQTAYQITTALFDDVGLADDFYIDIKLAAAMTDLETIKTLCDQFVTIWDYMYFYELALSFRDDAGALNDTCLDNIGKANDSITAARKLADDADWDAAVASLEDAYYLLMAASTTYTVYIASDIEVIYYYRSRMIELLPLP